VGESYERRRREAMRPGLIYDSLVIGAGFAGLSAALQLARSNRHVMVLDSGSGRSTYHQINHNYLGFPGGISARELRAMGRKQVEMYPVAFLDEGATALTAEEGYFTATTDSAERISARTVVLATGVRDRFPAFPGWETYIGRSIFWCIVCDGYSTRGKRLVIVGNDDHAGVTALQFLQFTNRITVVTNSVECGIGPAGCQALEEHGIRKIDGELAGVLGHDGILGAVELADGTHLPADFLFSLQGSDPNNDLAVQLGLETSHKGYVVVDPEQKTSMPGVFAAGDVTRGLSHQVATAVHEGLTAATAAQYFLYEPWQKHE
jgi:thioredoxin reductase (NADPH)